MVGFFAGSLLFARVGRWIVTLYEIAKVQDGEAKGIRLASAALLSDGPWFLFATALAGIYLSAEPWALDIFVGMTVAIAVFGVCTFALAHRARTSRER